MEPEEFKNRIREQWPIQVLAEELCDIKWEHSPYEPDEAIRELVIADFDTIFEHISELFTEKEFLEMTEDVFWQNEVAYEYMDVLANIVSEEGFCRDGKKPRPVHGGFEDGLAILSQYRKAGPWSIRR